MIRHYIRKDDNKNIIKTFTTAFEEPEQDDICVNENGDRHYNLDIKTPEGYYKYKYDKEIIEKTQEEIDVSPEKIDREKAIQKEIIIQNKIRETAIAACIEDGDLDSDGEIK